MNETVPTEPVAAAVPTTPEFKFSTQLFGGLNKHEVSSAFGKLTTELAAARAAAAVSAKNLAEQQAAMDAQRISYAQEMSSLREVVTKLQSEYDVRAQRVEESEKAAGKLAITARTFETALSQAKQALERETKARIELQGELTQLRERSERYDRLAAKVGDILLVAKDDADRIRLQAEQEAQAAVARLAAEYADCKAEIAALRTALEHFSPFAPAFEKAAAPEAPQESEEAAEPAESLESEEWSEPEEAAEPETMAEPEAAPAPKAEEGASPFSEPDAAPAPDPADLPPMADRWQV